VSDIVTERLVLRLVPLAALAATAQRKLKAAERIIGARLPQAWLDEDWVFQLRHDQWREDPAYAPWSIRAIVLKSSGEVVGNMNCHHKPMPFVMNGQQTAGVELGYTIFEPYRRKGYASEMIKGFTGWAGRLGVSTFVLSISPRNEASLALARRFGAEEIGRQIDERDGEEIIFAFQRVLPSSSAL
jgi:RimJ/RimL family protein N-acetyltransferase